MTFGSEDVRHAFHKLPAGLQVFIHGIWGTIAKQGYLLHIEGVADDGELLLRLHRKADRGLSLLTDP